MKFYMRGLIILGWVLLIFSALWTSSIEYIPEEEDRTIQVFGWPEQFLPEALENFERETGIKVKMHYYTTNEELLVKLKATEGKGYDLIIPSDYAVQMLLEEDLLKPLDRSKLNFLETLNPALLGHDYDPQNQYSLPYQWEVFAFGIDAKYFQNRPFEPSWKQIFNLSEIDYKIAMVNDPIEAVNFAAYYLYGPEPTLDFEKTWQVHQLLKRQKQLIEAYAGLRADYLLVTKNCHLAISTSSYLLRAAKNYPHVKFVIPNEWSFISIENMCLPKHTNKDALVYTFLNYVYRPEILGNDTNTYYNFPATTNTLPYLDVPDAFKEFLQHSHEWNGKFYFIRHLIPEKDIRDIWVKVKS